MRLTEQELNAFPTKMRSYKKFDGGGLFIHVMKSGARYWRYKYTLRGEEKLLTLGIYPSVSLEQARERHAEARADVANGIDPNQTRRMAKLAKMVREKITFQQAALNLYGQKVQDKPGDKEQLSALLACLERDVFPYIGARPVLEITPFELITILLRKEQVSGTTPETLGIRNFCSHVIRHVIMQGGAHIALAPIPLDVNAERDNVDIPTLKQSELKTFLKALQGYKGTRPKLLAIRLLIMTGVNVDALRSAAWTEFDFDEAIWTIPAWRLGTDNVQHVPLSTQARGIVEALKSLTGFGPWLFPSRTAPQHPVSEASLDKVLTHIGYGNKISVRSFYPMMRKILIEQGATPAQLDTPLLAGQRQLLQAYADVIDTIERGGVHILGRDIFTF